jgi:hypothetical protein
MSVGVGIGRRGGTATTTEAGKTTATSTSAATAMTPSSRAKRFWFEIW